MNLKPSEVNYLTLAESLGISGRASGRELRAGCPIHGGQDANFALNLETGLWNCFSSCGGGDFTALVQKTLGVTTREAERWITSNGTAVDALVLAKQLRGLLEDKAKPKPQEPFWKTRYGSLSSNAMPIAFLSRGFTWGMIERWGIKYDPTAQQVVIPYYDHQGELIGTISRNMVAQPKYLNSAGLPKSLTLFGYRSLQTNAQTITIVEGPLDAIWLQEHGYPAVALVGLDLSDPQVHMLQRKGAHIVIGLDADVAGNERVGRLTNTLWGAGWSRGQILRLKFPNGRKDAQECSPEELRQAYDGLAPYTEE